MSARTRPAIAGGTPTRDRMLPYGRQTVTDEDRAAVDAVLRGDWLTTGPAIPAFEAALREVTGAAHVVAMNSGTAALHAAVATLDLAAGDEVILPSLTFAASANAILYCGGRPVFAEVHADTFCLDPADVERRISPRTRAIMTVHYAGSTDGMPALREIAERHGLPLVEDAAHSLGARDGQRPAGAASELATLSFHPVKHITTAEGGAVVTRSAERAARMRRFRNHGISLDVQERARRNTWHYEVTDLGYNYRLPDVGAALGTSQLQRLPEQLKRRRQLASRYMDAFANIDAITCQRTTDVASHAWHIFPILISRTHLRADRDAVVAALRAENIGANVHYDPVHLHPYYQRRLSSGPGDLPITEDICARLVTLPLFAAMSDTDQTDVINALRRIVMWYAT